MLQIESQMTFKLRCTSVTLFHQFISISSFADRFRDKRAITLMCKSNEGDRSRDGCVKEAEQTEGFLFRYVFFNSYLA